MVPTLAAVDPLPPASPSALRHFQGSVMRRRGASAAGGSWAAPGRHEKMVIGADMVIYSMFRGLFQGNICKKRRWFLILKFMFLFGFSCIS